MEDNNKKRARSESSSSSESSFADSPPPDSKRFRPDQLIDILDDDDEEVDSGAEHLADVMRSLEEEIFLPSPPPPPTRQHDLGYLLEASDDELGLPPAVGSETPSSDGGDAAEAAAGFGRIWGFEDDVSVGYGSFGFGFGDDMSGVEDGGVGFDFGLFDYSDMGLDRPIMRSSCAG